MFSFHPANIKQILGHGRSFPAEDKPSHQFASPASFVLILSEELCRFYQFVAGRKTGHLHIPFARFLPAAME
jgi:hypothetical protein